MIEGLLDNLKGGVVGDLMSKFGLDEKKASGVFSAAGEATKEEMTKNVTEGGLSSVMSLFSSKPNGDNENSMLSGLQDNFIGKITSKLGIDPSMATSMAGSIIPKITGMITSKNEETDESDSSSIMSMFGGDKGGIMDSIKGGIGGFFK